MARIPAMVDLRRTPAENAEVSPPMGMSPPAYPWGLCISLTEVELEKLSLPDDMEVGDMIHMHCMAKVTSVSKTDNESTGPCCRVELQITNMVSEDEDEENAEEDDAPVTSRRSRLYG